MKVFQSDRTVALSKRKIQDITSKFTNAVSLALTESQPAEKTDVCDNCMQLVHSIKYNLKESDKERKMRLLTLVSHDWSIHRTMEFLKGSEYSVKAKKLKKEK